MGEIYSKLFHEFDTMPFTFSQAEKVLGIGSNKLNVAFSKLHSERVVTVFKRSRPRVYRLMDPSIFIGLLASEEVQNVEKLSQERYLPLILKSFIQASKIFTIRSFAVYGSVARGTAKTGSDIDILVISEDFKGSLGERIEQLLKVEYKVEREIKMLKKYKIFAGLSFYPLKPEEAELLPDLFLDLTEDAVILYDENRFLEGLLLEFKAKLLKQGAKRVFLDKDRWYWDLSPGYRFGDPVEIR